MLKIFNEIETNEDIYIYLKLVEDEEGGIMLVACDVRGYRLPRGSLLRISETGINRSLAVDVNIGISLNKEGRVSLEFE